ncbi:hypothetical protein Cme02nite_45780 [Catellatospora methionotrophica]|uniref:Uncharacterized protein n=1 Tax=Catellatospora methionotrophica TaxID=121620 RepID=A0A8J3PG03_9ACTN|nr:hypothetical protein Cme02nite_45780 [Catellatospora methionotrophica]
MQQDRTAQLGQFVAQLVELLWVEHVVRLLQMVVPPEPTTRARSAFLFRNTIVSDSRTASYGSAARGRARPAYVNSGCHRSAETAARLVRLRPSGATCSPRLPRPPPTRPTPMKTRETTDKS